MRVKVQSALCKVHGAVRGAEPSVQGAHHAQCTLCTVHRTPAQCALHYALRRLS
jgi:hypothetical protein